MQAFNIVLPSPASLIPSPLPDFTGGVSFFSSFFCGFEADFGHGSNEITRIPYLTPMFRAMVLLVLICVGCYWLRETTPIEPLPEPHS